MYDTMMNMLVAFSDNHPIVNAMIYGIIIISCVILSMKLMEHIQQSPYRHVKTGEKLPGASLLDISRRVLIHSFFTTNHLSQEIMRVQKKVSGNLHFFHCFVGLSGSSIVFAKPEHVQKILRQTQLYPKHNIFTSEQLHKFWGDNVLVVEGGHWKRMRSVMNSGFYNVERYMNLFAKKVSLCLDQWDTMSPNMSKNHLGVTTFERPDLADPSSPSSSKPVKILVRPFMQKMTLDVLGCTIFGYDFRYLEGELGEYLEAYNYVMGQAFNIFRTLLQVINRLPGWLYPPNKKINEAAAKFDELAYTMIGRARQRVEERRKQLNVNRSTQDEEDINLLEQMIEHVPMNSSEVDQTQENAELTEDENNQQEERQQSYSALTDKELRDNLCVFFIAGHETTAYSLSFALYSLAKYPHVQEKAREEVMRVIGPDQTPSFDQLTQLTYVNYVINEVLRMYPPISVLNGRLQQKAQVFDGYKLPKDTVVQVFIYGLHYNKDVWGDPEVFRPERFEPAESKTRPQCSFIPFSSGPRTCIGKSFSMYEMRMFVAMLLQRYNITLPPEDKDKPLLFDRTNLVISPKNDLGVILHKRQQTAEQ